MPGFFDRINSTTSETLSRESTRRYDGHADNNNSSGFAPKSDSFNIFAQKPSTFQDNSDVKTLWTADEPADFGYQFPKRSELDPPLINSVFGNSNASQFVKSGNNLNNAGNPAPVRRQKYMPVQKTALELLEDQYQIQEGPVFDKVFGLENDCEITVTGGDGKCPIINTFQECNFCPELMENITLKKYRTPTQIQKCVIPLILFKDVDVMGHAQTGSGKTASFALPIINKIQWIKEQTGHFQNRDSPYAIIIAPTKELAEQLANDARSFAGKTDVKVAVSYGDMPLRENLKHIRYGCDIFVGTCGRLIHFVKDEILKLTKLKYFILDEADKLLNDTFLDGIKAIKNHKEMNPAHRTFMFSATFGEEIQSLAQEFLRDNYFFVRIGEMNRPADTVEQCFLKVKRYDKQDVLLQLFMKDAKERRREDGTTFFETNKKIVFVQRKRQSDRLAIALAQSGFLVTSINADRTLKQRFEAAEKFTKGLYHVLVATDVAARGLNFPNVTHVINFDLPEVDSSSYIHRIGRAGRAGNLGKATSFFDPEGVECEHIAFYVQNLRSSGQPVPKFMQEIFKMKQSSECEIRRAYNQVAGYELGDAEWY